MKFKSDSQRKACFANIFSRCNKFSLKYNHTTNMVTSTEYPNINFLLLGYEPNIMLKELKMMPEQHLSGLSAVVEREWIEEDVPAAHSRAKITIPGNKPYNGFIVEMLPYTDVSIHPQVEQTHKFEDVLAHEIGHNVIKSALGKDAKKLGDQGAHEMMADKYMAETTGGLQRWYPKLGEEEDIDRAYAYLTTLQELKTPSLKKLSGYAGEKFSFDERKRKGYYPADSNLSNEFDTIVLNTTFDVVAKQYGSFNPDDELDKSVITGLVCAELDKNWKSEWGKRPDGHYLRADVEDALERLR